MKSLQEIRKELEEQDIPYTMYGTRLVTVEESDLDGFCPADFAPVEQIAADSDTILFTEGWESEEAMYSDMAYCGMYTGQ